MGTILDDQLEATPEKMRAQLDGTTLLKGPVDPEFPFLGREFGQRLRNIKHGVRDWTAQRFPNLSLPRFREDPDYYDSQPRSDTATNRVYQIFEKDETGIKSPELMFISEATSLSFMAGLFIGMREGTRGVKEKFIRIHAATIFANPQHAKRELMNTMVRAGIRGGVRTAIKVSAICFMTVSTATLIATIRNRSGIIEYGAAGATAGFFYRLPMGPRAQLVASATGGILGAVFGSLVYSVLKASGTTMEEVLKAQHERRREQHRQANFEAENASNIIREKAIYEHDNLWDSVRSELEASGVIEKTDAMGQIPNKGFVLPSFIESTSAEAAAMQSKSSVIDKVVPIQLILPGTATDGTNPNERLKELPEWKQDVVGKKSR